MNRGRKTECGRAKASFSGYLDGAISGREMQSIAKHLECCAACDAEFAAWRGMQRMLGEAGPAKAPADLALRLRVAISHEATRGQELRDRASVRWENLVRPLVLRTLSGLACALLLFGGVSMLVGMVVVPNAVLAHDEPLGAVTMPHYLYSAAQEQAVIVPEGGTVVVEAEVNADGKVYDWNIVSGAVDERTRAAVEDDLMLEVYEPSKMFGQPVRGRVLVTFSGVLVKG